MSQAQYDLQVHQQALSNIRDLDPDTENRVESTLLQVSKTREVASHEKVEQMQNHQDVKLYKIRVGDYRALAYLDRPTLQILQFGHRNGFYDSVDEVCDRLA